jgi:hypothetical protein
MLMYVRIVSNFILTLLLQLAYKKFLLTKNLLSSLPVIPLFYQFKGLPEVQVNVAVCVLVSDCDLRRRLVIVDVVRKGIHGLDSVGDCGQVVGIAVTSRPGHTTGMCLWGRHWGG